MIPLCGEKKVLQISFSVSGEVSSSGPTSGSLESYKRIENLGSSFEESEGKKGVSNKLCLIVCNITTFTL